MTRCPDPHLPGDPDAASRAASAVTPKHPTSRDHDGRTRQVVSGSIAALTLVAAIATLATAFVAMVCCLWFGSGPLVCSAQAGECHRTYMTVGWWPYRLILAAVLCGLVSAAATAVCRTAARTASQSIAHARAHGRHDATDDHSHHHRSNQ